MTVALALSPGTAALAQTATQAAVPPALATGTDWMPWLGAALGIVGGTWALLAQLRGQRERRARERVAEERDAAVLQARRLSRQLDATLAALPDLLFEFDGAGRYVAIHVGQDSPLLAAAPRHIIGRQVDDLLPPAAAAVVHESLAAAQLHGHDHGRRVQLKLPDGEPRWFELASGRKPVIGQEDDEHVLMLSRDITALVRAEQRLDEQRRELQDSRQSARFQALFEQAPAPLAVLRDGRFVLANPAFQQLAGPVAPALAVADWLRQGLVDPQLLSSLDASWLLDDAALRAPTRAPGEPPPVLHLPWRGADGRRRLLQLHGRHSGDACVLGLCDLSLEAQDAELARAEARAAALQLQWVAASWGPPLRRLTSALGPLGEQGPGADALQLLSDLQQVLAVVTDAAPSQGSPNLRVPPATGMDSDQGPAPLGRLAATALHRLARSGRARQRELVLQVEPALGELPVAPAATWCALLLALGHAQLHASADAGALVVTLSSAPAAPSGTAPPHRSAAQEPGSTTGGAVMPDPFGDRPADGPRPDEPRQLRLTLALHEACEPNGSAARPVAEGGADPRATAALAEMMARALCERLGGRWTTPEPPVDAATHAPPWRIDLPWPASTEAPQAPAPPQATAESPDPGPTTARPAPWRALVIDDLPAARLALQRQLQAAGLTVAAVDDAAHALARLVTEQAEARTPELICIDERMPDMDGLALGLAIRALQLPGPPLLVLCARTGAGCALPEGFDARLDKPLQPMQIERLVERLRLRQGVSRGSAPAADPAAGAAAAAEAASVVASAPASTEVAPPATAQVTAPPASPARPPQVLLVDDNALNREVAADALRHAGIAVTTAEDGLMALEWLEHHTPDLILMDMQMPRLDGVRTTEVLRQMPALRAVPVIALTANGSEEDRERCLAVGMDDHLCKPVPPASLLHQVERWLAQGRRPSSSATPAPAVPLLDTARGLQLCGGGQALYRAMLGHFIDHHGAAEARLREAWQAGDAQRVDHLVHTLKGSAAQIGARRLQQACETVEAGGASPVAAGAAEPVTALLEIWSASVEAARRHRADDER